MTHHVTQAGAERDRLDRLREPIDVPQQGDPVAGAPPRPAWPTSEARPPALRATELAVRLRNRELCAVEVLESVLARADEVTETVNPFSVRLDDAARRAAEAADRVLDAGRGRPLTGVPVSVKDSHWLAGVETTYGSRSRIGFVPGTTTGAVQRLLDAGAVIFAKTTTSEFCYFGISENPVSGRTRNPWNLDRTAGGSSGGAAAALAAGVGPLSLGGDGGGSIRIPAAFCGLVGFKPTYGRVPHEPSNPGWKTLAAPGPLATSVADARLMLHVVSGFDSRDRHSAVAPPARGSLRPEELRVAVAEDLGGTQPVDDDVRAAFRRVVAALARSGVQVVEDHPGLPSSAPTWATIACAEARWSEAREFEETPELLSEDARSYLAFGEKITAADYIGAQFARERIHEAYLNLFARTGAHVLLTPTLGLEAFGHGSRHPDSVGGVPVALPWLDWAGFLYDANLAGLPACAVPTGVGATGLPVSVQVVGRRWEDPVVLAAAQIIESTLAAAPPVTSPSTQTSTQASTQTSTREE